MYIDSGTDCRNVGSIVRRAVVCAVCAALALLLEVLPAQAREGLYAGLGAGNSGFSTDIAGTETYQNAATTHQLRIGKPEAGSGIAFTGGYGFTEFLAIDLLVTRSSHTTIHNPDTPAPQPFEANLNSVLFALKVGAPLGDVAEVFGRVGMGGYELEYEGNNFSGGSAVDGARLSGRGFAAGVGAELFFGAWGLQLAYTLHDISFDSVQSAEFATELEPALEPSVDTVSVLFVYYLK